MHDLMDALNISKREAVGILELLWHFAAEYAPHGDIGRFSIRRIEAACDWESRKPGRLVLALLKSRWLDLIQDGKRIESENDHLSFCHLFEVVATASSHHLLVVHDWHDHCEDSVHKRVKRSGEPFLSLTDKVTGQRRTTADHGATTADKNRLPSPSPSPMPYNPPNPPQGGGNGLGNDQRKPTRQERRLAEAQESYERIKRAQNLKPPGSPKAR